MQPCGREMQSINSILNQQFDPTHDEFLDQILSSVPSSWPPDLSSVTANNAGTSANKPHQSPWDNLSHQTHLGSLEDQSTTSLASKLRQHQIGSSSKALMFQQQLMLSSGLASDSASGNGLRSPTENGGFLPMPLRSNGDHDDISHFDSAHSANDASVQALYDQFTGSLGQPSNQLHHFHSARGAVIQAHNIGAGATMNNQSAGGSGSTGTGGEGGPASQPKQQRVRARRGQATDPHSIAERLRRERIAERMKALQELVPNANKTDKASMLDEIVDYVKFLQLQVKVLSMSRLGGAAAVAPRVAVMSSEVGEAVQGNGRSSNGTQTKTAAAAANDTMTVTEHQVAKLMEEDMGSAMQYLQGKGLCLMPISLATAISTATCQPRSGNLLRHTNNHHVGMGSNGNGVGDGSGGPSSPNISGLTVQSATLGSDHSVKDAASVSKP